MSKRQIIAHFFQWKLKDIINELDTVKLVGYDAIQISPLQGCKDDGNEFWKLYQPTHMSLVGSKQIGTKEDLIELCSEAKKRDIKIIADVVLRHTAGVNDGRLIPHEIVDKRLTDNPYFWTNAQNTTDYKSREKAITRAFGMPMLDYNNWDLQDIYIKFLDELREAGCDGFRIDMGKHFGLKEEGSVFWERVFDRYSSLFNYAECLECDKNLLDKYTKFINVITDYYLPTDNSKAVVYMMSHDTEETWGFTKRMKDNDIIREWKNLLNDNKESHVLFYIRSWSDLWKNEEIKRINNTYR
jgi:alpha-amylase